MQLEPLYDNIIVKPDPPAKYVGLFEIPDTAVEVPETGTVLAVGEGRLLDTGIIFPLKIKVGDIVNFSKFAGQAIKTVDNDGRPIEVKLLREDDIRVIIKPKQAVTVA